MACKPSLWPLPVTIIPSMAPEKNMPKTMELPKVTLESRLTSPELALKIRHAALLEGD